MTQAAAHESGARQARPELIQGGMGVGVSNWRLARAVGVAGEKLGRPVLGVVSGTGLSDMLIHRIQQGDVEVLGALEDYDPGLLAELQQRYGSNVARRSGLALRLPPKPEVLVSGTPAVKAHLTSLTIAAAYIEVTLAKRGHRGPIGMNILEKLQLPQLPVILGAMLAGVDYLLVGAGIPNQIPAVLSSYAAGIPASLKLDLAGTSEKHLMTLDPGALLANRSAPARPRFLAIVSHHALAMRLASTVEVDGFVIEGPTAGGHNAPARDREVDAAGQPVYGPRDEPDLARIKALGKPFWLAGSYARRLDEAKAVGATGIQVGSAFALCEESGLTAGVKRELRCRIAAGALHISTSTTASPTGFPFQVVELPGSLSEAAIYDARRRVCNIGQLVEPYSKPGTGADGIGFRCPAEPVDSYLRKGGRPEKPEGAVCLCNGLAAAAGYGRIAGEAPEPIILTLGKNSDFYGQLTTAPDGSYAAEEVVRFVFHRS